MKVVKKIIVSYLGMDYEKPVTARAFHALFDTNDGLIRKYDSYHPEYHVSRHSVEWILLISTLKTIRDAIADAIIRNEVTYPNKLEAAKDNNYLLRGLEEELKKHARNLKNDVLDPKEVNALISGLYQLRYSSIVASGIISGLDAAIRDIVKTIIDNTNILGNAQKDLVDNYKLYLVGETISPELYTDSKVFSVVSGIIRPAFETITFFNKGEGYSDAQLELVAKVHEEVRSRMLKIIASKDDIPLVRSHGATFGATCPEHNEYALMTYKALFTPDQDHPIFNLALLDWLADAKNNKVREEAAAFFRGVLTKLIDNLNLTDRKEQDEPVQELV